MALALVRRDQGGSTASQLSLTISSASHTAGNLLVALFEWNNSGGHTISSVANSIGDTWVQAGSTFTAGTNDFAIFYATTTAGGTGDNCVIQWSAAQIYRVGVVYEISGADATSPLNTTASGNGATSPASTSTITLAASTEIICAITSTGTGTTKTPGTGYTLTDFAATGDANKYYADLYHIASSNEAPSCSFSPTSWGMLAASFKVASASAAVPTASTFIIAPG